MTWKTGHAHFGEGGRRQVVPSLLAHYYLSDLHVRAACGAVPRGPLVPENLRAPGARRCARCAARHLR